ncbi:MAG TPA: endo-1,4-beta-xylanase [Edaphobacter sp.]|nr:endo-1,4-beta-xylanase [Edaphobacter sp.]
MMTRREYLKQAAGAAAAAMIPGFLEGRRAVAEGAVTKPITGKNSLKARAAARGLLAGCAVNAPALRSDEAYRNLLTEQYNLVVAEYVMKWAALRPTPDTYAFDEADELMAFAQTHGMKVRGHNFVWHESLPKWFEKTVMKDNAQKFMTDHIMAVGGRYKGRIHSWDVVNEAIWIQDGRPDGLRSSSPWMQMLGPEYIDIAFKTARQADPKALLTYNEYGIEYDTAEEEKKRAAVLGLLQRLKTAGTPLDALGIQSHMRAGGKDTFGKGISELIASARGLGLQVFITEMDVKDHDVASDDISVIDRAVADVYRDYLTTVLRDPSVKAVLTWGASDKHAWMNDPSQRKKDAGRMARPLPFDKDYAPKEAFFAIRDAFDGAKKR